MDLPQTSRNANTLEDELNYLLSQVSDSDLHKLLGNDSTQSHQQALSAGTVHRQDLDNPSTKVLLCCQLSPTYNVV